MNHKGRRKNISKRLIEKVDVKIDIKINKTDDDPAIEQLTVMEALSAELHNIVIHIQIVPSNIILFINNCTNLIIVVFSTILKC